jgi:ATP-dependent protease ClpP protease subunit
MLLRFVLAIGILLGCAQAAPSKTIQLDPKKTVRIQGIVTSAILLKGKELMDMSKGASELTLLINSPGGQVTSGLMFIDLMEAVKSRGVKIRCVVPNLAASMAFDILAHCNSRYSFPSAILLFHPMKTGCFMCMMSATELLYDAERLKAMEVPLNDYLMKAMNVDEDFYFYHYMMETAWTASVFNTEIPGFVHIVTEIQGISDFESMGDSTSQEYLNSLVDSLAKDF